MSKIGIVKVRFQLGHHVFELNYGHLNLNSECFRVLQLQLNGCKGSNRLSTSAFHNSDVFRNSMFLLVRISQRGMKISQRLMDVFLSSTLTVRNLSHVALTLFRAIAIVSYRLHLIDSMTTELSRSFYLICQKW